MATYLQGVTDYIPQVQPWAPDFNFYQNVLERSQNKYDQNWNKVNSIYNGILNAPMMREQNQAKRDDFFKNIEGQLNQMASLDLSLDQNVDAAAQVFKPFYEDENIIKDIGFTKKYQDEMQRSEYLRTCTDKEKCGDQYWDGGVRAMQYQVQDFIDASDEDALRMRNPEFTSKVNVMEKYSKALKDSEISMTVDSKHGGYIYTTTNGAQIQEPIMNFLMASFGEDPELQKFYSTKAYLKIKENPDVANDMFMASMKNPNLDEQQRTKQVQDKYITSTYENSKKAIDKTTAKEGNRLSILVKKRNAIEKGIRTRGIVPGSEEANQFIQLKEDVVSQNNIVNQLNGMASGAKNTQIGVNKTGLAGNEDQMRAVIANGMMIQDMFGAAVTLSYRNYEQTMKADQFALAATKHGYAKEMANLKQGFALQNKGVDYFLKKSLTQLEAGIKNGTLDLLGNSYWLRNKSDKWGFSGSGGRHNVSEEADAFASQLINSYTDPYSGSTNEGGAAIDAYNKNQYAKGADIQLSNSRGQSKGTSRSQVDGSSSPLGTMGGAAVIERGPNTDYETKGNKNWYDDFSKTYEVKTTEKVDNAAISMMKNQMKDVVSQMKGIMLVNNKNINSVEEQDNDVVLNTLLAAASDASDPGVIDAHIEMLDYGQLIWNQNQNLLEKPYDKTTEQSMTKEEYELLKGIPTNTSNTDNNNADYYTKLQNIGTKRLTELAGGVSELYKFSRSGKGLYSYDDDSASFMNKEEFNIVSDAEYTVYSNKLQAELAKQFNGQGGYKDESLTPEMRNQIRDYEKFNTGGTFERRYGEGSSNRTLQRHNNDKGTINARSRRGNAIDANEKMIKLWNTGMRNALKAIVKTSGNDPMSPIRDAVRESILVEGKDGLITWGGDNDIMNAILMKMPELQGDPSNMQQMYGVFHKQWGMSIQQFDNEFAKDGPLTPEAKLQLLSRTTYASTSGTKEDGNRSYTKIDLINGGHKWLNARAGKLYHEDAKLPADKRQYSSLKDAVQSEYNAAPTEIQYKYLNSNQNQLNIEDPDLAKIKGMRRRNLDGNATNVGMDDYDHLNVELFQWLGGIEGISNEEYEDDGNPEDKNQNWTVTPNYDYYNAYAGNNKIANSGGLTFQLNNAKVNKEYLNRIENANGDIADGLREFTMELSNARSTTGGLFKDNAGHGIGVGAHAYQTLKMNNISYAKGAPKDQNYIDSRAIIKEGALESNIIGLVGIKAENAAKALTYLAASDTKEYGKGEHPQFNLSVEPVAGSKSNAQIYTIEFTDHEWAKKNNFNQYNKKSKSQDAFENNPLPMSFSFRVEDPTNELARASENDMYDVNVGTLGYGETYTDKSLRSDYGDIYYTNNTDGSFTTGLKMNIWNPVTFKEESRHMGDIELPGTYHDIDWPRQNRIMVDNMIKIKEYSNQAKEAYHQMKAVYSPEDLAKFYRNYEQELDKVNQK